MRGLLVTGTDTGVGKSVLAAAICTTLAARGERVAALKPAATGLDEAPGSWPHDHELLGRCANAGQTPEEVAPYRYGPAASPHHASALAGEAIEPAELVRRAHSLAGRAEALVVEGVGGLMVPLTAAYLVCDLAVELALPVVIASRPGLGTINHTLLTVEAARSAGLAVAAVVMTPWPEEPSALERSNRETVERLSGVIVTPMPRLTPDTLGRVADALPVDDWLVPAGAEAASAAGLG
jgi:dethiobiotin synthetase